MHWLSSLFQKAEDSPFPVIPAKAGIRLFFPSP
jgi:hypothetical protein